MHKIVYVSIPLTKPYLTNEELEEVKKTFKSGWIAGQGPKNKELAQVASNYLNIKNVIPVNNCTAALHLALLSLKIGRGDEVIVSDYTFPATGHSVMYVGATPRFADIDIRTYNVDSYKIEELINDKTKAIIPVHTFGNPCKMDEMIKIARKNNLFVVEDAACAMGAKYKNKLVGTFGDIGCFSFHARKSITTGEGGLVAVKDGKLAGTISRLSCFGMASAWKRREAASLAIPEFIELGYNYKLSDVLAAIGVAQFRKLKDLIQKRRHLAKYYDEKLQELDFVQVPFADKNVRHTYQSYVCLLDKKVNRNKIIIELKKLGVETQIGTYSSCIQPVYKSKDKCPVSIDVFNRAIALPMYYELTEQEVDKVVSSLKKVAS